MVVLHFWFVVCPVALWEALTPLSFGRLIALVLAYVLYAAVTAALAVLVGAVLAALAHGLRRGFSGRRTRRTRR